MTTACLLTIAGLLMGFDDPPPPAQSERLLKPTMVKLDFRDRPLFEVVDAWNARHDFGLRLQDGPVTPRGSFGGFPSRRKEDAWSRRITLESPRKLPFWEAIDRLCEVAGLEHDVSPIGGFGLPVGQFLLYSNLGGTRRVSDTGPLRVKVTGLQSAFESDFVGDPAPTNMGLAPEQAMRNGDLNVSVSVIPAPGLVVRQAGPARLSEAVDDQGRSLLPAERPKPDPADPSFTIHGPGLNQSSGFGTGARLHLPDQAGRSIGRLRGTIPVVVVGFAPGPIVISLKDGVGKTVRDAEVAVTLLGIDRDNPAGVTVEVEVNPDNLDGREPLDWQQRKPLDFTTFGVDQLTNRIELLDADGRELALQWNQGSGHDMATIRRRIRLTPTTLHEDQPPNAAGGFQPRKSMRPMPVELRYYGLVQASVEIPFDFRDIPLP